MEFCKLKVGEIFVTRRYFRDMYYIKISDNYNTLNAVCIADKNHKKLYKDHFKKYEYIEPISCDYESCMMCVHYQVCMHVANNSLFGQNIQITDDHERALRCQLFLGYCDVSLEKICDICDKN